MLRAGISVDVAIDGTGLHISHEGRIHLPPHKSPLDQATVASIYSQRELATLRFHVLKIASETNIIDDIVIFARWLQHSMSILIGSDVATNATLRQLVALFEIVVTLHNCFKILSLSKAFHLAPSPSSATEWTIYSLPDKGGFHQA
ncbi:AT-hook motif nuclear-localized protein 23-like [Elaeis guineensis]|uniref:AT-hook motif nuclear-localized protein 23-like n=1 Tax=Elaeis guineensis var. tenera TaxID=51953 RepID=UPI003C6D9293